MFYFGQRKKDIQNKIFGGKKNGNNMLINQRLQLQHITILNIKCGQLQKSKTIAKKVNFMNLIIFKLNDLFFFFIFSF